MQKLHRILLEDAWTIRTKTALKSCEKWRKHAKNKNRLQSLCKTIIVNANGCISCANNITSTGTAQGSRTGQKKHEGDIFMKCSKILSPMTGEAVGLGEVPDPVFSQKIVGDGMAVIPSEGKLLSPVDGEIISVADTKHAYGLRTAEGLELLIHVGLETVHLNGECFQVFVKPGDKVKAGDLLAEVDLAYLKERGINPITPVLVCGGFRYSS